MPICVCDNLKEEMSFSVEPMDDRENDLLKSVKKCAVRLHLLVIFNHSQVSGSNFNVNKRGQQKNSS